MLYKKKKKESGAETTESGPFNMLINSLDDKKHLLLKYMTACKYREDHDREIAKIVLQKGRQKGDIAHRGL